MISTTGRRRQGANGSALIVVLWTVGLLSLVIASFAFDAHVEARITSFYRKRGRAETLAHSGLEVAKMLMIKSRKVSEDDEDPADPWLESAQALKKGALSGLTNALGDGVITLDMVPEPGRRNINKLGNTDDQVRENLERILEVGNIPEELWPVLTDSFLDWVDANDEPRLDGAESEDYYETLETPYRAKNGPLDTVGELLLIRGFNRTIVEGGVLAGEENPDDGIVVSGIGDLLTTYGRGKVNINAASERVLRTLPGVDELVGGAIIEEREGWVDEQGERQRQLFESVGDLFVRIPDLDPSVRNYVETQSSIYRITSQGEVGNVRREVWCIAEFDGRAKELKIKRWREND